MENADAGSFSFQFSASAVAKSVCTLAAIEA